jgi:hypothetical protein
VLSLLVLLDDLGELLPHLPVLLPPRLLDLAAGVLMGFSFSPHASTLCLMFSIGSTLDPVTDSTDSVMISK